MWMTLHRLLTYARVGPEQALVLDALEELPEVAGGARAGAVGAEVGSEDLHHGVPARGVRRRAGLRVRVSRARLLVPAHSTVSTRAVNKHSRSFTVSLRINPISEGGRHIVKYRFNTL